MSSEQQANPFETGPTYDYQSSKNNTTTASTKSPRINKNYSRSLFGLLRLLLIVHLK